MKTKIKHVTKKTLISIDLSFCYQLKMDVDEVLD